MPAPRKPRIIPPEMIRDPNRLLSPPAAEAFLDMSFATIERNFPNLVVKPTPNRKAISYGNCVAIASGNGEAASIVRGSARGPPSHRDGVP
jgi:hypothetical protein